MVPMTVLMCFGPCSNFLVTHVLLLQLKSGKTPSQRELSKPLRLRSELLSCHQQYRALDSSRLPPQLLLQLSLITHRLQRRPRRPQPAKARVQSRKRHRQDLTPGTATAGAAQAAAVAKTTPHLHKQRVQAPGQQAMGCKALLLSLQPLAMHGNRALHQLRPPTPSLPIKRCHLWVSASVNHSCVLNRCFSCVLD